MIGEIWKIRTVKDYKDAHSHLVIGEIIEENLHYLRVKGRSYNFGHSVNRPKDIKTGVYSIRLIPWNRIEIINVLPSDFDHENAQIKAIKEGHFALMDERFSCVMYNSLRQEQI